MQKNRCFMELPSGFIEMAEELLKEETPLFLEAMRRPPEVSIRLNPRKPGAVTDGLEPVQWCPTGFYLPQRPVFTLDPLLHAGAYYVQDASSMIYYELTKKIITFLGNPERVTLLDLCAAPGGKTTAMIDALPDGSRVVANEYVAKRAGILRENLSRWGYPLATVTNRESKAFAKEGGAFDIVAVDAPCSGEGMMRKEPAAIEQWSPRLIEQCAALQKEILANAAECVAPGGFLIYSTCTFNRLENEENVEYAVRELGLESVDPFFPTEWNLLHAIGSDVHAFRFMPHRTRGEGLFLTLLRKPGDFEPSSFSPANRKKESRFNSQNSKETVVPEIEEILSVDFDKKRFPLVEISKDRALSYLRRESIILPEDSPRGIVILTYKGLPLGAAKNIGSRANNLYPKNRRIRL